VIERLGVAFDRMLRSTVESCIDGRDETEHRADVDDASRALFSHGREDGLGDLQQAEEIRIEKSARLFDGRLLSGTEQIDAGVVDQQINFVLRTENSRYGGFDRSRLSDVDGETGDPIGVRALAPREAVDLVAICQ
jgi:hypothetical protein